MSVTGAKQVPTPRRIQDRRRRSLRGGKPRSKPPRRSTALAYDATTLAPRVSKTSPKTSRRSRSRRLSRDEWKEVFTVWSEIKAGGKLQLAVVFLAMFSVNRLEPLIGLAGAWAAAFGFMYVFGCLARWRHFRTRPQAGEDARTGARQLDGTRS